MPPPESLALHLLSRLPDGPDVHLQRFDVPRRAALLVCLDADGFRQASFLDDRVLRPDTQGAWVTVGALVAAAAPIRAVQPVHFIAHSGHVGSTLVSRLLDATGGVLSLREPLPLRTLAEAQDGRGRPDAPLSEREFGEWLALCMRLWGRGYPWSHTVVVKATSSAARVLAALLRARADSRAICMNLRTESYLATLLAGANSPIDLLGHGPERLQRLQARLAVALPPLDALTIGELAALSWVTESWTQTELLERFPGRVLAVDFDQFLAAVAPTMERILTHFGVAADPGYLAGIEQSPLLAQYSKAPEHSYSPALRAELLRTSRLDNAAEIRRGLAWLERLARSNDVAAALVASGA